jgi:hypothetical protein
MADLPNEVVASSPSHLHVDHSTVRREEGLLANGSSTICASDVAAVPLASQAHKASPAARLPPSSIDSAVIKKADEKVSRRRAMRLHILQAAPPALQRRAV